MKTQRIFILLGAFNGTRFIEQQIDSIQNQSLEDWRLLVRDDESTDNTVSVVRDISRRDHRIELLEDNLGHLGAVHNFSTLMQRSHDLGAEYVFLADQDDVWCPEKISDGVLFSIQEPSANKVAITGEFTNWSREGIPLEKDAQDGLWKLVIDIQPGEYEYRYIVDGVWIRDPNNRDYIRNEFGQENSLLIV